GAADLRDEERQPAARDVLELALPRRDVPDLLLERHARVADERGGDLGDAREVAPGGGAHHDARPSGRGRDGGGGGGEGAHGRSLRAPRRGDRRPRLWPMAALIAPSILSADFANLERDLNASSTAGYAHVDVLDNHFVPNLTLGLPVFERLAQVSPVPIDAHLMIEDPDRWAPAYAEAGA